MKQDFVCWMVAFVIVYLILATLLYQFIFKPIAGNQAEIWTFFTAGAATFLYLYSRHRKK